MESEQTTPETGISDRYHPKQVETKTYAWWESQNYFQAADQSTKPPFSVILPPPNVTGSLHMGHALNHSIQDLMIRWKRMSGFNALWLPGTDHAGIATQTVVEKELKKKNLNRKTLGREKFVEQIWDWKNLYGERIFEQMRRLGDSCDWNRKVFTLDEGVSRAVKKVFVSLHKKGLIYRGKRLVNWSWPLESAISDLEVEHKNIKGTLFHIQYPLADQSGFLTIATTRPETLLGDTAICVHPEDIRYQGFIGKEVIVPLTTRKIKVIADNAVDPQFGTGALKITPGHDFNDFKVGKTHQLELINILEKNGTLNENAGVYKGLSIQEARKKVVEDLKKLNLLVKEEPHPHSVGHCQRSGAVVEPFLSEQWFLKMDRLAVPAKHVVENGTVRFEPESWVKVYLHWLNNLEDWCVSRQLWWGHRIPAWTCSDCGNIQVSENDVSYCEKCRSANMKQDEDVLDTWFSSALWPFSTMGWPQDTETQKTFYPTSFLVTGHDILFFWVARMIMMGLEFKKDVPFRTVYFNGIVRDSKGQKMSKSVGNVLDPLDLIEKYGADSLRLSLLAHISAGRDLKISEPRIEGYRNFMNKLWNASRFVFQNCTDFDLANFKLQKSNLNSFDQAIIEKLGKCLTTVDKSLHDLRFADASQALYHFVWHEYCDWYLEFSKSNLKSSEKQTTQYILLIVLEKVLRAFHPMIPFITEELYQMHPMKTGACIIAEYPKVQNDREFFKLGTENAETEVDLIKEVITAVRNIRGENRLSPALKLKIRVGISDEKTQKIISENRSVIMSLARLDEMNLGEVGELKKCAVSAVSVKDLTAQVIIPLEGLVDFEEEIKRMQKAIEKCEKDISLLSQKLSNPKFLENADEEVVEVDKQLLTNSQKQIVALREGLTRFR